LESETSRNKQTKKGGAANLKETISKGLLQKSHKELNKKSAPNIENGALVLYNKRYEKY